MQKVEGSNPSGSTNLQLNKMSKIFIAYQFRGENEEKVEKWLKIVRDEIIRRKYEYFCSFWTENDFKRNELTIKQIYDYCLKKLENCEIALFLIRSKKDSEGMKIELEYALNNAKKIIVIIKEELEFEEYRKKADYLLEIKDISELKDKIMDIEV